MFRLLTLFSMTLLLIAAALTTTVNSCFAAGSASKLCPLGVNIGMPDFVDVMKAAHGFYDVDKAQKDFALDSHGWPTSDAGVGVFDNRVNMPWSKTYPDAVNQNDSGDYHLSFTGQATITPDNPGMFTVSNQVYHAATNTTTAILTMLPGPANNLLVIKFTGTKGGVQNVKLIRPGYPANTKQIFTTRYLNAIKPFAAMRLVDFLAVNAFSHPGNGQQYPMVTNWADRRLPTDAAQTDSGGKHGVAWEYAIELANETGKDLWINVPIAATDDYVTQLAALFKKTLNPKLHIYVEYSNEVWNYGFPQNWWNGGAAKAENIDWPGKRYAKRTVEIGQLFSKVYGPAGLNTTIRPVLVWQEYDYQQVWNMLKWIDTAYGPPKNVLYAICDAVYIDTNDTSSVDATLTALAKSSDASRSMTEGWAYVAQVYGLKEVAYEGGVGMSGANGLQTKLDANRDPRIMPILKHHLVDNWYGAGGSLFMYYALVGTNTQWGTWGLIENDLSKPNTPKYQAAVEVAHTPMPPPRVGFPFPTVVGQSASLDEYAFLFSNHNLGTPDQNIWGIPGDRHDYPIQVDTAGTYSMTLETFEDYLPGTVQIWVDGKMIGNAKLPETASVTLLRGPHTLWTIVTGTGEKAVVVMGGGKQIVITRTR